jgi:hypothetical protein
MRKSPLLLILSTWCGSCAGTAPVAQGAPRGDVAGFRAGEFANPDLAPAPTFDGAGPVGERKNSVELRLEASVCATSGSAPELWLVARFSPPPGAHLYWLHPGESGLKTQAVFSGPPEATFSEVQYPGPIRFRSERGSISYGYTGNIGLLSRVTLSNSDSAETATSDATSDAHAPPGRAALLFRVAASWLACSDVCIKEHGSASVWVPQPLPTNPNPAARFGEPSVGQLIDRIPTALEGFSLQRIASQQLHATGPAGSQILDYFPLEPLRPADRAPLYSTGSNANELTISVRRDQPLAQYHGVLRVQDATGERYVRVSTAPKPAVAPPPMAACPSRS